MEKNNKLAIANLALMQLNLDPIDDLRETENLSLSINKTKNIMVKLVDHVIFTLLEKNYWQWAIVNQPLKYEEEGGGYLYPQNCLRLIGLGFTNQCCPCCIVEDISTTPNTNLKKEINNYLKNKNSDNYLSSVSFTMVNGFFNYHISEEDCYNCNKGSYEVLYYISDNVNDMKMPESFKEICVQSLISKLTQYVKHDPQNQIKVIERKRGDYLLYKEIEREITEFKYRFPYTTKKTINNFNKSYNHGFKISPFEF